MKVFAISDIHTDFVQNWELLQRLVAVDLKDDVLIVAGDVSHNMDTLEKTLALLSSRFLRVFFIPGNHELWADNGLENSVKKLNAIFDLCKKLQIQTTPLKVRNIRIVPLLSWYHSDFDPHNSGDENDLNRWGDFYLCRWPADIGRIDAYFAGLNEPHIRSYQKPVISFSHFLPRIELLPPLDFLRFKGLPKVAGSPLLEKQIRRLQSTVHVYGHSHINFDFEIDGIRYVQNSISYPREKRTEPTLKEIWNSEQM